MINPDTLSKLTTLSPYDISQILDDSGYSMCSFDSARFQGITTSGDFCYTVRYYDEGDIGDMDTGAVFISYDHESEKLSAEF